MVHSGKGAFPASQERAAGFAHDLTASLHDTASLRAVKRLSRHILAAYATAVFHVPLVRPEPSTHCAASVAMSLRMAIGDAISKQSIRPWVS